MKSRVRNIYVKAAIFFLGVCLLAGVPGNDLLAEGSEGLGPAGITVASGSGVVAAGTGMICQPGNINITVPNGAQIKQVLLYWEGFACFKDMYGTLWCPPFGNSFSSSNYDSIKIRPSGSPTYTDVTGSLIGGPTWISWTYTSTYRADITSLGLVAPGANSLDLDGLQFDQSVQKTPCAPGEQPRDFGGNGAGIVVIFDDGSGEAPVDLRDGNDYAYYPESGDLQVTKKQIFTFPASSVERTGNLWFFFSSVEGPVSGGGVNRPNSIEVTINGVTTVYSDLLNSSDGDEWDTLSLPVTIPPFATTVEVQAFSRNDTGEQCDPASMVWSMALLHLPDQNPLCDIGGPYADQCQGTLTDIILDGSGSFDPEGQPLSYLWDTDCEDSSISDPLISMPTLTLTRPGTGLDQSCSVTLTVSDGANQSQCSTTVDVPMCFIDCMGVPNGTAVVDQCGICNGNNDCLCVETDVTTDLNILNETTTEQKKYLRKLLRKLGKSDCGRAQAVKRFIKKTKKRSKALASENFQFILSIPGTVNSCQNNPNCVDVSNVDGLNLYTENSNELFSLSKKAVRKRFKCLKGGTCKGDIAQCKLENRKRVRIRKLNIKKAATIHTTNLSTIANIPDVTSECN